LKRKLNHIGTAAFLKLADDFEVIPLDIEEAAIAGQILGALARTGQKIGELDPFIAATAIHRSWPLVPNNTGHYRRIVNLGFPLELDNWRDV
jgi:tRNA(fMet)-specific endonuclease VapC